MKILLLSACLAVGTAGTMAAFGGTDGSVGTFVTDSAVTSKVKLNLAAKHLSTLVGVGVDTDKDGVVWLSGTAPTANAKNLAEMITRKTAGVTAVHNHIVVD